MTDHDPITTDAARRLERQADVTAYCARRFAEAARRGDLDAARRWRASYQVSASCCRVLGGLVRAQSAQASAAHPAGDPTPEVA